jgi:hypothetical protein
VKRIFDRLIRFIKATILYTAFTGYILVQVVLLALLLAAVPTIWLSDSVFVLFLVGLLLIGAGSYIVFKRLTREREIRAEAERWLAERRHSHSRQLNRRKTITRWAVWIPIATAVLVCVFFDETWALATHVFQPGSGKIIGYRVSIPRNWMVA